MEDEGIREEYRRHTAFKLLFIALCILFMFIAAAVSITIGGYEISVLRVYEVIWDHLRGVDLVKYSDAWYDDDIVWNTRLPRVLFAIVAGIGLAVSGAMMQSIMKNPLAEPYTTGVSAGAYLGVALSMAVGFPALADSGMVVDAFLFAMLPVVVLAVMSPRFNDSVASIILLGTALAYMFNAASTIILVSTDSETLASVYRWQVGSFTDVDWDDLRVVAVVVAVGALISLFMSRQLNLMSMGDEGAQSLGLNVKRIRIISLVVMACMVAAIVAYSGIIGFIGLICPHIVRLIIGSDNRFLIPAASAFGAAFLLMADTLAKYMSSMDSVPVGAVAALIGAPVFLLILVTNRRRIWRAKRPVSTAAGGDAPSCSSRQRLSRL